jgi:pimeloyl-ACP methyl ester carboxylesterase
MHWLQFPWSDLTQPTRAQYLGLVPALERTTCLQIKLSQSNKQKTTTRTTTTQQQQQHEFIGAWYTKAKDSTHANAQMYVLYCHGNTGTRAVPHRIRLYQYLAEVLNYNVLSIDYRGFADSSAPRAPTEDTAHVDVQTAYDYILDRFQVQPGQVIVYGHSLGTGISTRLVSTLCDSKSTASPAGLVLEAPFNSVHGVIASYVPLRWLPISLTTRLLTRIQHHFPSDQYIGQITCPVQVIHGEKDSEVFLSLGLQLVQQHRQHVDYLILKDAGHDNNIDFDECKIKLKDFLATLTTTATTAAAAASTSASASS